MSIRADLQEDGLAPRKKLGQHFLTDPNILNSIAAAAEVGPDDTILEIGPGLGHLTRVLAARARRVVAVELDPGLARKLEADLAGNRRVVIRQGDFLKQAPSAWLSTNEGAGAIPAPFKVVANVPYYITSAILRHLLEAEPQPSVVVLTVQKEVAQRLAAKPPRMNLVAVSAQFYAAVRLVRTIAAGAFYPRPQVDSAVVRLDVQAHPRLDRAAQKRFFEIVRAGFSARRKQLRNALAGGLGLQSDQVESALARARIAPTRRAENLGVEEWIRLYGQFHSLGAAESRSLQNSVD